MRVKETKAIFMNRFTHLLIVVLAIFIGSNASIANAQTGPEIRLVQIGRAHV